MPKISGRLFPTTTTGSSFDTKIRRIIYSPLKGDQNNEECRPAFNDETNPNESVVYRSFSHKRWVITFVITYERGRYYPIQIALCMSASARWTYQRDQIENAYQL